MAEDDFEVPKTHKRLTSKTTPPEGEPSSSSGLFTEDMTCDSQHANWNCVTKGKIRVLEVFAGSARLSQCCALTGRKVGIPMDIRTGFDVMTSKGRRMVLDIIREQQPDDQKIVAEKRAKYLPMIDFVASVARYQMSKGLYFIRESADVQDLDTLFHRSPIFCAFGLRDPDTHLRSLKPTSLMIIFRRKL